MVVGPPRLRSSAEIQVRDELIGRIAHDVRTPISAILTWLELLKGYSSADPKARHAVEMAQQSARDLAEIVSRAEDAQRIVTGALELEMAPVDLVHLLRSVADRVRPAAESRGVVLEGDLGATGAMVRGDGSRLRQAFTRVLSHCVSLSGPGTVQLGLRLTEHEAKVSILGPALILEAPLLQALLAEGEWPCMAGPSGQALLDFAVAGHVIRLHGGRLEAQAQDGQGTRVSATLPVGAQPVLLA